MKPRLYVPLRRISISLGLRSSRYGERRCGVRTIDRLSSASQTASRRDMTQMSGSRYTSRFEALCFEEVSEDVRLHRGVGLENRVLREQVLQLRNADVANVDGLEGLVPRHCRREWTVDDEHEAPDVRVALRERAAEHSGCGDVVCGDNRDQGRVGGHPSRFQSGSLSMLRSTSTQNDGKAMANTAHESTPFPISPLANLHLTASHRISPHLTASQRRSRGRPPLFWPPPVPQAATLARRILRLSGRSTKRYDAHPSASDPGVTQHR